MSERVELYIYDLSGGMARQFSGLLGAGIQLEGVWHTAIVVYGQEWFYGGHGIACCAPGTTMMGPPLKTEYLGETRLSEADFKDYLNQLERGKFAGANYNLLQHNCNNFSNEVSRFLCNKIFSDNIDCEMAPFQQSIPQYILDLPGMVMNSPLASMLAPIIEQATPQGTSAFNNTNASSPSTEPPRSLSHLDQNEYVTFKTNIDVSKVRPKIKEVDDRNSTKLADTQWSVVDILMSGNKPLSEKVSEHVSAILKSWSPKDVFPILDLLRFSLGKHQPEISSCDKLVQLISSCYLQTNSDDKALFLSLRCLSNMFQWKCGLQSVLNAREELVQKCDAILQERKEISTPTQVGLATLFLNYSLYLKSHPDPEAIVQIISSLCTSHFVVNKAAEAVYRNVVALGVLVKANGEAKDLALALEAEEILKKVEVKVEKIQESVNECKKVFAA